MCFKDAKSPKKAIVSFHLNGLGLQVKHENYVFLNIFSLVLLDQYINLYVDILQNKNDMLKVVLSATLK